MEFHFPPNPFPLISLFTNPLAHRVQPLAHRASS